MTLNGRRMTDAELVAAEMRIMEGPLPAPVESERTCRPDREAPETTATDRNATPGSSQEPAPIRGWRSEIEPQTSADASNRHLYHPGWLAPT